MLDTLEPTSATFRRTLRKLQELCTSQIRVPSSHLLKVELLNINKERIASGGFSDVFRGTYDGGEVCVKKLRVSSTGNSQKVTKGRIHRGNCQAFTVF